MGSKSNKGPNVNRLLELVGIFTLYPERHEQTSWFAGFDKNQTAKDLKPGSSCGTTLCTAGWAAVLYGPNNAIFVPDEGYAFFVPNGLGDYYVTKKYVADWEDFLKSGDDKPGIICDKVEIPDFAEKELGLTGEQAFALFYSAENLEQVLAVIRKIISKPKVEGWELVEVIEKVQYQEG